MHDIWLIGAGKMAQDYIKVLSELKEKFVIVGRSKESAKECKEVTGCSVKDGGLNKFLDTKPDVCSHAVVAVGVDKLYDVTKKLLEYGVKNILVEKPGSLYLEQLKDLIYVSKEANSNIMIAYNRRFYASVIKAQDIIKKDGGVSSFNFEFTEWAHVIETLDKGDGVKEKWFLGNSTHVVDLAFFLGGKPIEISTYTQGTLDWHRSASNFAGAGKSENGALFSYHANWESAGRWSVEILTKEHRLIFKPMEKLQIQSRGTLNQEFVGIDYSLDEKFKPGVFLQTRAFLANDFTNMCDIGEQFDIMNTYCKIANYPID